MAVDNADPSLDPLEQKIRDLFKSNTLSANVFGPYFEFLDETQGLPYILVKDAGGGPTIYTMTQPGERPAIDQIDRTVTICHSDRAQVLALEVAIDGWLETIANEPLKDGSVLLSAMPHGLGHWRRKKGGNDRTNTFTQVWESSRWYRFRIERQAVAG